MKINWKCFFENSSTEVALIEFIEANLNLSELKALCWPKECKDEIDKMIKSVLDISSLSLTIDEVEDRMANALRREGHPVSRCTPKRRCQRYVFK